MDNKKVTYIVEVGYNCFEFEDGVDAIRFARIAKQSFISDFARDRFELSVEITVKFADSKDMEDDE